MLREWDCHAHVIESGYAWSAGRGYDPPIAPLADYLAFLDRNEVARGVLVQPSVFGFDNRCLLDALDRADGRLRGIVVPDPDTTAVELEAMHDRGVRGVRCNTILPGGLSSDVVVNWKPVLRELGWHVELHIAIERVPDLPAYVGQFGVPVVIDHMGRPTPGHTQPTLPHLQQLIELVRAGECYVKLSAPYRLSNEEPPWRDVIPLAQALLSANAEHCLWGSDWPHSDTRELVREEDVFASLNEWCGNRRESELLLTSAAAVLFF